MSSQGKLDHSGTLEVSPAASVRENKRARNGKLKSYHPDRILDDPDMRQEAECRTKAANAAPEVQSASDDQPAMSAELDTPNTRDLHWPSSTRAETCAYVRANSLSSDRPGGLLG